MLTRLVCLGVWLAVLPLARWVEWWARWERGLYYVDARRRLGFWLSAVARSPGLYLLRPTGEREIRGLIDLIRIQEGEVWKQGFELRAEQASVACISWMMRGAVQESRNSMALQEKILDQSLRKLVAGPPERLDTSFLFLF